MLPHGCDIPWMHFLRGTRFEYTLDTQPHEVTSKQPRSGTVTGTFLQPGNQYGLWGPVYHASHSIVLPAAYKLCDGSLCRELSGEAKILSRRFKKPKLNHQNSKNRIKQAVSDSSQALAIGFLFPPMT